MSAGIVASVEHALGVVGEDDGAGVAPSPPRAAASSAAAIGPGSARGVLRIDAEQLVPAAEVAGLDRRRPAGVGDEPAVEAACRRAERAKLRRRRIVAGDADQDRRRPIGDEIGRDIAGAAEERRARARWLSTGDRRLRRDAADLAFDEAVEQNVADDEHPCLSEAVYDASIHGRIGLFSLNLPVKANAALTPNRAAMAALFDRLYGDHLAAFERARPLLAPAAVLAEAVISVLRAGGKLLLCGNGGSAADAQHIATEFTVRFETTRRGLPAIALTTDTSALTAASNDLGYRAGLRPPGRGARPAGRHADRLYHLGPFAQCQRRAGRGAGRGPRHRLPDRPRRRRGRGRRASPTTA